MNHSKLMWHCACAVLLALSSVASAQSPAGWESPRTPNGKPDFSGFWSQPRHVVPRPGGATTFTKEKMPPFVPGGEALFYEPRTGDPRHDEPRAFCQPSGFPSAFFGPYPVQIVQTDDWLVMSFQGRALPGDCGVIDRAGMSVVDPHHVVFEQRTQLAVCVVELRSAGSDEVTDAQQHCHQVQQLAFGFHALNRH